MNLLTAKGHTLDIPEAVKKEILQGPLQDSARLALGSGWGAQAIEVTDDPIASQ